MTVRRQIDTLFEAKALGIDWSEVVQLARQADDLHMDAMEFETEDRSAAALRPLRARAKVMRRFVKLLAPLGVEFGFMMGRQPAWVFRNVEYRGREYTPDELLDFLVRSPTTPRDIVAAILRAQVPTTESQDDGDDFAQVQRLMGELSQTLMGFDDAVDRFDYEAKAERVQEIHRELARRLQAHGIGYSHLQFAYNGRYYPSLEAIAADPATPRELATKIVRASVPGD